MAKIYFIADTHFGETAICLYENRPFSTTGEMDGELIRRWNQIVSPSDQVYHLGDLGGNGREAEIVNQLNGEKFLVKGNHDVKDNQFYRDIGFAEVYDKPILLESFFLLSHEPLYVNTNMPYANIFGHVHASPLYKTFSPQHYCVSVERIDYTPISLEKIVDAMKSAQKQKRTVFVFPMTKRR